MSKEHEFNKLMAEFKGLNISTNGTHYHPKGGGMFPLPDYYNDLNLLMPLAWEHYIDLYFDSEENLWTAENEQSPLTMVMFSKTDKNPIQAVRACLIAIAKEQK